MTLDVGNSVQNEVAPFDFEGHERNAVVGYLERYSFYENLANVVAQIIQECISHENMLVHSVQHRAKSPTSFGKKAAIPSEADANSPKYNLPLEQITDLAGVRIITQFHGNLKDVNRLINNEFDVVEQSDKSEGLVAEDRFGYQSIHYLVRLKKDRSSLAEYRRFSQSVVEIQVRTILQHAWAEIEHDIQYKSSHSIPREIRRRFMALAGLLELADREFQSIQNADKDLSADAADKVSKGDLVGVEVTPRALKQFLDSRLGSDGRMRDWSYEWASKSLKKLGFEDLRQVEAAIKPYDDSQLSVITEGGRLGQITRFEIMLLAALGKNYVEHHSWSSEQWFAKECNRRLDKLAEAGVEIGTFSSG